MDDAISVDARSNRTSSGMNMMMEDIHVSNYVQPAPFLSKTYQLVEDPCTNHIVSWNEDETGFVVWRPPEFAKQVLPNYFKHNNFSSFVRQLNTYGFRKVVPERWEFANDYFKRGQKHLLSEIHRRKSQSLTSSPSSPSSCSGGADGGIALLHDNPYNNTSSHVSSACHTWSQLQQLHSPCSALRSSSGVCGVRHPQVPAALSPISLSDENERLRRDNTLLLYELSRLRNLYNHAIAFLQNKQPAGPVQSMAQNGAGALRGNYQQSIPLTMSTHAMMPAGASSLHAIVHAHAGAAGGVGNRDHPQAGTASKNTEGVNYGAISRVGRLTSHRSQGGKELVVVCSTGAAMQSTSSSIGNERLHVGYNYSSQGADLMNIREELHVDDEPSSSSVVDVSPEAIRLRPHPTQDIAASDKSSSSNINNIKLFGVEMIMGETPTSLPLPLPPSS